MISYPQNDERSAAAAVNGSEYQSLSPLKYVNQMSNVDERRTAKTTHWLIASWSSAVAPIHRTTEVDGYGNANLQLHNNSSEWVLRKFTDVMASQNFTPLPWLQS